ncbi:ABC transporter permease [Rhizobium lusitanum]|uniref:ABC transporter permease n=1 Tax=Rhizobium lusitanum TaxID=293958 RepID=A0A6L9U8A2_9HYPH|nr:ABC transporter permease [Rhizobium lusitanum]NEI71589.1 ABC transporter permease [Rhizobium lusitanum]
MSKKDLGLLLLIIVVGIVVAIINPRFLLPINLANTSNLIGLFGILSIGQAFVIITGGIELSVGSLVALLGVLFIDFIAVQNMPWAVALPLILILGGVLGAIHGWLITKLNLQPFVVTLCGLLIYRGAARFYTADGTAGFAFGQNFPTLEFLTAGRFYGVPNTFIALVIIAAVMWIVLHRSVYGRYLYAIGKNEEAAKYSGIRTRKMVTVSYTICGVLTALSAIYFAMYTRSISPASHGQFYELYAIAAAVLGGFSLRGGEGSLIGVVLGTILLQELQNLVNLLGIPSSLNFAVMGGVILLGVLIDQQWSAIRAQRRLVSAARQAETRQPASQTQS